MNKKRLRLVLSAINIALVLIVVSIVIIMLFVIYYGTPHIGKFRLFSESLPNSAGFGKIKFLAGLIPLLVIARLMPVVLVQVFYAFILWQMRKIVISMLVDDVFRWKQIILIRKIAYWFLGIACIFMLFALLFSLAALEKGNMKVFVASLTTMASIFQRYILSGLISLGLAEVFIYGMKIREEQDLTI